MRHTPKNISTHSLTRRLTLNGSLFAIMQDISTHSLTRRLTTLIAFCNRYLTFQLTASQGGWLYVNTYRWNSFHFNSQPHKEADRFPLCVLSFPEYFNSQPHKEADLNPVSIPLFMAYFNSQPHKEADQAIPSVRQMFQHFNSQPHKEADNFQHKTIQC